MPEHAIPTRTNAIALGTLLVLTLATTLLGRVDLDPWNLVIALAIATAKTAVVAIWFMHLRHSTGLKWLVAAGGVLWLFLLLAGTFDDYATRAWLPVPGK
jgi:cytochrome c oxidase subunit 4